MQSLSASAARLSLASLLVTGCAKPPETPLPATTELLDELPRVSNSPKSPCWQQREIAKQWGYLHSIKQKKEVLYSAPCDVDKKPKQTAKPTTS